MGLIQDVRHGLRLLRKRPVFTLTAVLTLALGIGVNTTIFSVANAFLVRALPFRDADRLVHVWRTDPHAQGWAATTQRVSVPDYLDFRADNLLFGEDEGAPPLVAKVDRLRATSAEPQPGHSRSPASNSAKSLTQAGSSGA